MSTGAVIAVVVAVVVVLALVAALVMKRGGTVSPGLKGRFGPEYDRTLARHDGDAKATRRELSERVKQFGDLERHPLSAQAGERYAASWATVQARFVDEPAQAVNEADRLLAGLAAERGFPGAESPQHFNALSVHHPHEVQGYRYAHTLAEHGPAGPRGTEDLRQGLLGARALFDALVADAKPAGERDADVTAEPAVTEPAADDHTLTSLDKSDADVIDGEPEHRGTRSGRFAALTGGRRNHTQDEP